MRQTLFLHIGSHRTATTSIQHFMFRNLDNLLKQGVFYPFKVARHDNLMRKLFSERETVDNVASEILSRVADKPHPVSSVVLSDEDISMRPDPAVLAGFRDHFDVKVIYSLRRQDLWLESWFFQNIKWQWMPKYAHCTFEDFISYRDDFHWIHYDRYIARLEELFGQENIQLSIFEKEQMPDGPVVDFCRHIGITDLEGFGNPPHVNSSMSAEMVEFIRHLPLDQFKPPERDMMRRALEHIDRTTLGNTGKQSERLLPLADRRKILAEFDEGNRAIARRYFGRDKLFLAPLPDKAAPLANLALPGAPDQLMNRFVGPLISHLVSRGIISKENANKPPAKPPSE